MAIYGTLNQVQSEKHYVFESSNMKATLIGNIYDGVCDESIDNTTPLVLGDYTGDGLQLRKVSKVTDPKSKIVVAASVPLIKDAFTREQAEFYHFYNKAGDVIRCYEIYVDDIFGVSKEAITGEVAVGKYVKINASGGYEISASDPSAESGFVGRVHSIQVGTFYDLVRIQVLQNETVA